MFFSPANCKFYTINCKGKLLSLQPAVVMGILNITPDSFYDGGTYKDTGSVVIKAKEMMADGADILDIGGYSTRPGADDVPIETELSRVIPVIEAILKELPNAIISIDTFRSKVAEAAVKAGASIVNDISAGDDDPEMIATVARLKVPYIAMHKQGTPKTMQLNPQYNNVTADILTYFVEKLSSWQNAGIVDIIIDPGFGFGKTLDHNYELLKNLSAFKMLDCPILIGVSRKGMIKNALNISSEAALNGTTVLNTFGLLNGANIVRVHDVKEAKEAILLTNRLL